jgi:hypothetical protein
MTLAADNLHFLRDATAQLLSITAHAVVDRPERVTVGQAADLNALAADIEHALAVLERALRA